MSTIELIFLFELGAAVQKVFEKVEPVKRRRLQNTLLQELVVNCNDRPCYVNHGENRVNEELIMLFLLQLEQCVNVNVDRRKGSFLKIFVAALLNRHKESLATVDLAKHHDDPRTSWGRWNYTMEVHLGVKLAFIAKMPRLHPRHE